MSSVDVAARERISEQETLVQLYSFEHHYFFFVFFFLANSR